MKLNVIRTKGQSGTLGVMEPAIGMLLVNSGVINSLGNGVYGSGVIIQAGGLGSTTGYFTDYPSHLYILESHAAASFGWPTGVGCVVFTHATGVRPGGVSPQGVNNKFTVLTSSGIHYFTR